MDNRYERKLEDRIGRVKGKTNINVPKEKIAKFCKKNYIRRLSLFGSILREDLGSDSDIDLLVEFHSEHIPGLI